MTWAVEVGELGRIRWAQWVDVEAFTAWQWRLRDLYALAFIDHGGNARAPILLWAARDRLRARGEAITEQSEMAEVARLVSGQWDYLRDLWECLSNMLRALNQPAGACPSYVHAWVGLLGKNPSAPTGPWVDLATAAAEASSERVRRGRRCEAERDGVTICELDYAIFPSSRVSLAVDNSSVVDPLLRSTLAPAPLEGVSARWPEVDGRWLGAVDANGRPVATFGDVVGAEWWPGAGAAERLGQVNVLMSGYDALQLAHGVAVGGQLARRTWREIVARSRLYCVGSNLAQAAKYGGDNAEDIARINAEFEVLRYTATPNEALFNAAVEAYSELMGALNPAYGLMVRGLQLGVEALLDLVGRAQGREVDPFGRVEPWFQPWWIGGAITEDSRRRPEFSVPAAPPVDPSRYPLAAAPGELPSAAARRLVVSVLPLPSLVGQGQRAEELDPASVAAAAARAWGVDPRRGL